MFFRLAYSSLLDRKGSVLLALIAISVSIFVLLGIEHIRHQAKQSFSSTVSGTDLIVGAKTGDLNLLLYSVFRIGNPTNNIQWQTYQEIATFPTVDWTIPISLGDSHKGYRVLGTTSDYFKHFSYGSKRHLEFADGAAFSELLDVVIGAEVAHKLNYKLGDKLVLAHGVASTSFSQHKENPFTVVGILAPTGTPVDQTLHVSLEGIEAIHIGWPQGGTAIDAGGTRVGDAALTPKTITAFLVGLKSRLATFRVQRDINQYQAEPLLAILPGVTLTEFWQTLATMENTLRLISVLVLIAALLGLGALLLASIRERRREISIMRTLGASPWLVFLLLEAEAILITLVASAVASGALFLTLLVAVDQLASRFGLHVETNFLTTNNLYILGLVLVCSVVISLIPAIAAYRQALHNELSST